MGNIKALIQMEDFHKSITKLLEEARREYLLEQKELLNLSRLKTDLKLSTKFQFTEKKK